MQGLPINLLTKSPMKGAHKIDAQGMDVAEVLEGNENAGEGNLDILAALAGSSKGNGKVDFASMLKSAKGQTEKSDVLVNGKIVKADAGEFLIPNEFNAKYAETLINNKEVATLENSADKTNAGLGQILKNLNIKPEQLGENQSVSNEKVSKSGFFPNAQSMHKNILDENGKLITSESKENAKVKNSLESLDNILNGKNNSESDSEKTNSFFPNQVKVGSKDGNLNAKPELKLVSSADFLDQKNAATNKNLESDFLVNKKENLLVEGKLQNEKGIDLNAKNKNQSLENMGRYLNNQNAVSENVIKNNKEIKKGKGQSVEELKSNDLKKTNDYSVFKEASTPMLVTAKNNMAMDMGAKAQSADKILDLSSLNPKNTNEIIKQISNYVEQNQVAGKDQLDLLVKHDSLGQFQIQVSKGQGQNNNLIDMQITTSSPEGHKFFVANENALVKSLQQSGVGLSDLKILTSMSEVSPFAQSESKQFSSFSQNSQGGQESFQSFEKFQSGDFRQGSERRKELWNEYRERFGA